MTDPQLHLDRDPEDAFDRVLCEELRWDAPPDLSLRLLALIPAPAPLASALAYQMVMAQRPPRTRAQIAIMVLTAVGVVLSCLIAVQFYAALANNLGLQATLIQISTWPALATEWLFQNVPVSRVVLALVSGVQDQLHWLLLALILWVAFDGWTPRVTRQQTA